MDSVTDSILLDEITAAVSFNRFEMAVSTFQALFDVRGLGNRRWRHSSMAGLSKWDEVAEGAASPNEDPEPQFTKDITPAIFKKKTSVTREFIDDERWDTLEEIGAMYGDSAAYTMDDDGAALFNDAFTGATYKAEDDKSICNDAHTNAAGGNSQDNSLTNSLSMTGLKNTRQAFRDITDYGGRVIGTTRPNLLLIPNEIEETGLEIARSTGRPDTANRADNVYSGTLKVIVWDRLTDANAWFLIDEMLMKRNLKFLIRVAMEIWGAGDLDTGSRKIGGYMRYGLGCLDWRWVMGNNPS